MALTEIQIANMALARLGNTNALTGTTVSSIPTLGEDGFAIEGQQVVAFYSHCRERTLRDYPWVFASKLAELDLRVTDDGTLPWSGRWTYEYAYPSDALLIRAVRSPGEARDNPKPNPFEVTASTSDRVIRTDVPDGAIGEYTLNITTVGIYSDDPKFVSALAWLLAFEMAPGLGVRTRGPTVWNQNIAAKGKTQADAIGSARRCGSLRPRRPSQIPASESATAAAVAGPWRKPQRPQLKWSPKWVVVS